MIKVVCGSIVLRCSPLKRALAILRRENMDKLETNLVGVAGEYFVAAELSRKGYIAAITLRNSRGIDIIASNGDGTKSVSIQVKTNSNGSDKWILSQKSENFSSDNHYYVFVAMSADGNQPSYHIVPSKYVAEKIKNEHKTWLSIPKKDGKLRKDSSMRTFCDKEKKFLNKWDSLGL
ncbi:hypothetical protein [Vibrio cholerae]|uniref:hypothetical protein n=2 Tax=Vibrio cholerae TaxID=666 RepID=UPI001C2558F1|nr:hypothetical protein [Vibrio cholerae]